MHIGWVFNPISPRRLLCFDSRQIFIKILVSMLLLPLTLIKINVWTCWTSFILLFSEVTSAISFKRSNLGKKLIDVRNYLIDMYLIQSLKNEFCFDLPLFSKYPATSINSNLYKMTLLKFQSPFVLLCVLNTLSIHTIS